ncbi:hypothetical protein [Microbispora hainanensis]|uniref:Uncharacterized protein n=1 Tax=Microbispora hainanensis TaxID=568844 RepID=A0A544Z5E9_9ACTN|nr:hypothetical protein [Microbispora hainanensis]TQS24266.1 hypothetical protein FLX08_00785 [Microbispora hainanensis]
MEERRARSNGSVSIRIEIGLGPWGLPEEVAQAAILLRRDLLQLDIISVDAVPSAPPEGAKGVDVGAIGVMLVSLIEPAGVTGVIDMIRAWAGRGQGRSVKVQLGKDVLEVTGVSREDQRRLIDHWIERHAKS